MLKELVKVTWLDAHGSAANVVYDIDEIPHAPIECTSYGILLKDDEVGVSIASEQVGVDTYRGYSFVPRGMLSRVEVVIKPKRKRVPKTVPETPKATL
jgi:hypothetical protein